MDSQSKTPRPIWRTLFGQISLALLLLCVVLGAFQYLVLRSTLNRADDYLLQIQMWDIAREFSNAILAEEESGADQWKIEGAVRTLAKVNPLVDAYLIRDDGEVLYSFSENDFSPRRKRIGVEPMKLFLQPGATQRAPIYGDDPDTDGKGIDRALFSASAFTYHGQLHYLYAVIRGQRHLQAYKLYSENLLARYFGVSTLTAFLVVIGFGSTIFYVLSRRVTKTVQIMRAFRDGQYSVRVAPKANDEIAELGSAFDEMADRIVRSIDELEHRDGLRRELIATVSHDLRGPLANILAHVEQTRTGDETLEVVKRNASQLSTLLSELFELAKLEAREVQPQIERHFLEPLFEDLLISYRPKADEHRVKLRSEGCSPGLEIEADLTMLGRVLSNLIENALRFTHPGGTITLGAQVEAAKVRVSVKDSGEGIDAIELPRIFEKYFQGEDGKGRNMSSCGLGLSIVRRLVELQGSEVSVRSTKDVGTEFFFYLPLPREQLSSS